MKYFLLISVLFIQGIIFVELIIISKKITIINQSIKDTEKAVNAVEFYLRDGICD